MTLAGRWPSAAYRSVWGVKGYLHSPAYAAELAAQNEPVCGLRGTLAVVSDGTARAKS